MRDQGGRYFQADRCQARRSTRYKPDFTGSIAGILPRITDSGPSRTGPPVNKPQCPFALREAELDVRILLLKRHSSYEFSSGRAGAFERVIALVGR